MTKLSEKRGNPERQTFNDTQIRIFCSGKQSIEENVTYYRYFTVQDDCGSDDGVTIMIYT